MSDQQNEFEDAFRSFCNDNNIFCEKIIDCGHRRPDFKIVIDNVDYLVECTVIKSDIVKVCRDGIRVRSCNDTINTFKRKIRDKNNQFKQYKNNVSSECDYPTLLLIGIHHPNMMILDLYDYLNEIVNGIPGMTIDITSGNIIDKFQTNRIFNGQYTHIDAIAIADINLNNIVASPLSSKCTLAEFINIEVMDIEDFT